MKISQFCKLFDITPGAVRFYIEKGLLIPAVVHGRYYFSEKDMADMRLLRRLKACRFSIPEIHRLMSLFRYSDLLFAREAEDYIRLLAEKRKRCWPNSNSSKKRSPIWRPRKPQP